MIRIKELFRLQNLKRLRLIAGQEGLERTVTAAVLLEYDSSRMQLPYFYRGDLVVTTLAYARGDGQLVANSLLALMNQGIAGLLVKTAYFSELPQSVVNMLVTLDTFLLAMAMAALGLTTHVSALKKAGAKPLLMALVLFAWLIVGGGAINYVIQSVIA